MARSPRVVRFRTRSLSALFAVTTLVEVQTVLADGSDRVRIRSQREAEAVKRAVVAASERLSRPGCQSLFSDFQDASGQTLQEGLNSLGQTPEGYLGWMVFHDGLDAKPCARRAFAVTEPGSRVVRICTAQFVAAQLRDPARAEATIIHEMLHSLGLGENPPSPAEITARVLARCMPERGFW